MCDPNQLPGIRIWTICGGLLITLCVAYFCFAQTAPSPTTVPAAVQQPENRQPTENLAEAKRIYRLTVDAAKARLTAAYDAATKAAMERGDLDAAITLRRERDFFVANGETADPNLIGARGWDALTQKVGSIDNWTIRWGMWDSIPRGFRGRGDSMITFNESLPASFHITFKLNVIDGMRPRMYFDGLNLMIGNEGYSRNIFVYGDGAHDVNGPHVAYENGNPIQISLSILPQNFELRVNEQLITGRCPEHRGISLRFDAGDGWSPGQTEFTNFFIGPVEAK